MNRAFELRAPTADDVGGIVAVMNAISMDVLGTRVALLERFESGWRSLECRSTTDAAVVTGPTGDVVSYVHLANDSDAPQVVWSVEGVVRPDRRGQGVGTALVQWAEQRAHELAPQAPAGARLVMSTSLFTSNRAAINLLSAWGFHPVRRFVHLRIERDTPPPAPTWPEGIAVRLVRTEDWPAVVQALEEAFQDHWGQITSSVQETENEEADVDSQEERADVDDPHFNTRALCFLTAEGDEVVGSCLCNAKTVEFPRTGRIGSLSVRRPWRGRGVGLALLYHAFGAFYRRGTRTLVTDTDGDSVTGANRMYDRAGMSVYRAEDVYEKEIRPGRELRVLSAEQLR